MKRFSSRFSAVFMSVCMLAPTLSTGMVINAESVSRSSVVMDSEKNIEENAVMTVEITEINGNTLLVKNSESPKQLLTLSASHLENVKPVVGMKLEVTFSGEILATYPEQFADVKNVTVINEKFDAEEFFVYVGTYGEELPQFRYFYQKSDGSYTADKVIWEDAPADINYGDVFVADGEISLTKVYPAADNPVYAHAYHYTIDESAVLNKSGSCSDIMEQKNMTVISKSYDGSSHWSIRYKDDADTEYYYGLSVLASSLELDPLDCEIGDEYTFALYNDYMVVPLAKQGASESYGIGVSKLPDKTVYQIGEELDLTGMRLNGSYTMGELVACIMNEDYHELLDSNVPIEVDTSMFDNTKAGTYTIYVMYGNAKDSFTVDVLDNKPASGDVNNDGNFVVSDVVLLQKYLIDVTDTSFVDWQAADFYKDGRLDVFDLVLMKRALVEQLQEKKITVDDIIQLSKKGDDLTVSDFAPYNGEDIGSGICVMKYEIADSDDQFYLLVGSDGSSDILIYARLVNIETEEKIDIRSEDFRKVVEMYEHWDAGEDNEENRNSARILGNYALEKLKDSTYNLDTVITSENADELMDKETAALMKTYVFTGMEFIDEHTVMLNLNYGLLDACGYLITDDTVVYESNAQISLPDKNYDGDVINIEWADGNLYYFSAGL